MTAETMHDRHGRGLADAVAAAGGRPPVLVIATPDTVGRLAPAWLESFDEAGWLYRVRSFGGLETAAEIAALAAEARSLGAKTIAAIGDHELAAAATAVVEIIESQTSSSISLVRIDRADDQEA
jgi:hypothetical protein